MPAEFSDWLREVGPLLFHLVVWGLVFAGTALFLGIFIPFITGDSLLFLAGALARSVPGLNIWVLAVGVGVAAFLGDQVGYLLGRRYGRPYLNRRDSPWIGRMVARAERFYELFGWWSVVIARYMPWIRVLIPPIAGVSGMPYRRFVTANLVGALLWGVLITMSGYLTVSLEWARPAAYAVAAAAITASVVSGVLAVLRDRRARADLSREAESP
ncbi:DedA family protein [Naasia sp. SYSU D00948]|uniref:DedA family protein n=1 Tax=Naasia sp. SYSU D00948 TaxID=2817379 RepID=UPI001B3039B0|nr:DedA family protein [Naasia sp. SYSU D00948]